MGMVCGLGGVVLVAACLGVGGCGDGTTSIAAGGTDRVDAAVAALGPSYTYELGSSCGERQLLGRFVITVEHGRVTAVRALLGSRMAGLRRRDFPTIADLAARVHAVGPEADVRVTTDHSGLPRVLSIDPIPDAVDDEECYRVTGVVRAQDENRR